MHPKSKLPLLLGLLSLVGPSVASAEPVPQEPQHLPRHQETGRDRANRRRRAQAIASRLHLDVDVVYHALGRGETEEQITQNARGAS